jgi:antimicrobial peptide system SdpB family protein
MLTRLGTYARTWSTTTPWTNVYGLARTLLALATAGTLTFSATETLFRPAAGLPPAPYCTGVGRISLFCLVPNDRLWIARWVSVAILLVVASGWRPRFTALLHWWISFGLYVTITIPDGGDQATAVLTLLMLPIAFTDPRRWHWQALPESTPTLTGHAVQLLALSALLVIRLQVAGIYLNSSLAKLAVTEWRDGTAVYYWIGQPVFGAPGWLHGSLLAVASTSLGVIAMTWGPLFLEFALAIAIVMPRRTWKYLLVLGILFHGFIALMMGLLSFSIAMSGALILYLRPVDQPFNLRAPIQLLNRLRGVPVPQTSSATPSLRPVPLASRSASR